MPEPTTEAGKRLLTEFWREDGDGVTAVAIVAIEAEAVRAVLTTLRERVEEMLPDHHGRSGRYLCGVCSTYGLVLAEIDRLMPEDKPEEGAS